MNALKRAIRPEQIREFVLLLLIAGVVIFFSTQINNFASGRTFNRIATSVAVVAVVAVGQTLVVLTRNIDLSVGSIVGFSAYFLGMQLGQHSGWSPFISLLIAIGVGALAGLINGLIVAYGRVPAIICTLGTMALYRTILLAYGQAKTVTTDSLPDWLIELPRQVVYSAGDFDLRTLVLIAIVVVILFQLVLTYLQYGRRLYAVGSNPDAAKMAGLPAQRIVMSAFVLCGALSGLAGFMFLARNGNITAWAAQGLELRVVAAAVVGGVNIFGGSGTVIGALFGAVLIDLLDQGLNRLPDISQFWLDALLGLLILLAVATDAVILNRLRKIWTKV
ncbi:MAG: ABC transporter permease [Caldilineaceae bacterium]